MKAVFDACRGDHDFCNLTPDDHGTVRAIDGGLTRDGGFLLVCVKADGSVREFVHRLASLVRIVGSGTASFSRVDDTLGSDHLDGPEGVAPAPPTPPLLIMVDYPEVEFDMGAMATESTAAAFKERVLVDHIDRRVSSRIREGAEQVGDAKRVGDGEGRG